jgi:hypothetical protein
MFLFEPGIHNITERAEKTEEAKCSLSSTISTFYAI